MPQQQDLNHYAKLYYGDGDTRPDYTEETFVYEKKLKELVTSGQLTINYVHGTPRSGSTIGNVIFSELADQGNHQPWRATWQNAGGDNREGALKGDADIYEATSKHLYEQALELLETCDHATITVKENARFFTPEMWQRWIQIPEKFVITIREPHQLYSSWVSAMIDIEEKGGGALLKKPQECYPKVEAIEGKYYDILRGGIFEHMEFCLDAITNDVQALRTYIAEKSPEKRMAIVDSTTLKLAPLETLRATLGQLGFDKDLAADIVRDWTVQSGDNWQDLRDPNRAIIQDAKNSKGIHPLKPGDNVSLDVFTEKGKASVLRSITPYYELLFAPENAALSVLHAHANNAELHECVPFVANAACLNFATTANSRI